MSEHTVHPVPEEWAANALIGPEEYAVKYRASLEDPENFWRGEAQRIDWIRPFTRVKDTSFDEATFGIRWFEDELVARVPPEHRDHLLPALNALWR